MEVQYLHLNILMIFSYSCRVVCHGPKFQKSLHERALQCAKRGIGVSRDHAAGLLRTRSGTSSLEQSRAVRPPGGCAASTPPSFYSVAHVPSSRAAASVLDSLTWQQHKHQTLTCPPPRESVLCSTLTTPIPF